MPGQCHQEIQGGLIADQCRFVGAVEARLGGVCHRQLGQLAQRLLELLARRADGGSLRRRGGHEPRLLGAEHERRPGAGARLVPHHQGAHPPQVDGEMPVGGAMPAGGMMHTRLQLDAIKAYISKPGSAHAIADGGAHACWWHAQRQPEPVVR